jgi:trigger factor
LNIQTERLENHTARFTVELDMDRLERAKQTAAKNIAKRVNIPGFRKGKVPYKILLKYVGEGAVLEDAVEILGNDIYKEALDQSGVDPYGPGQLEDFKVEPQPTFTFVVPLQPTVDLGDYRSTRQTFTEPAIEDDQVNKAMRALQEENAVVEESHQPVALGNRVNVEMYAAIVDENGEATEESSEAHEHDHDEHEHDHDHEHGEGEEDHHHDHGLGGNEFIHEHNAVLSLGEDNEEPAPGFKQALVGANVDETREFEVAYPDDAEEWGEELAGKKAKFKVAVKKIETMTLPSLNDELAARVTEKEEKPLSLLELRMRVRENLQTNAERQAKSNYAAEVLDKLVDKATIGYPDALVEDQIDSYMERLDRDLRQQGLTLEDYVRVTGKSKDDLRNDYRDIAQRNVKRSLVLREVMKVENVEVPDSKINEQIDAMLKQFGEQAESLRPMLDTPAMRENVRNDLLEQSVLDRIAAIAKGEAPELNATPAEESTETATSTEVSQEGESA